VFYNRALRRIFGPKRDAETLNGENFIRSSFVICTITKYYSDYQIEIYEMGGACGTCGGQETCIQVFGGET
jgi:hypothetical protein